MADYVNRSLREIITTLAACVGFAETLQTTQYRNHKKAKRSLAAMQNHAQKALDFIMEGLDQDQVKGILRYADAHYMTLVPKYNPASEKVHYSIEKDELLLLMGDAVSECAFCDKEGKAARRCKKRKILMNIGAIGSASEDCPYMGGIEI